MLWLFSIVGAVTSLFSLLTLGIAWLRPSYAGWRSWSIGNAALVLGMLVGVARTPETLLLSVLVGNGLMLIGTSLLVEAFERFSGAVPSRRQQVIGSGVVAALLLALWALTFFDSLTARFLLVSVYMTVQSLRLLLLIVREWRAQAHLRGAYTFNLVVLVTVGLLTLPRTLSVGSGRHPAEAFALTGPNVLLAVAALLMSAGGTLAFWVLHEDRRKVEVAALHRQLTLLAYHDPLTSLLNRRGLWEGFGRWSEDGQGAPATLLLLDINHFKAINDRQGHAVGDECLRTLGAALQELSKPGDLAGRVGGDEFVLLLIGPSVQITAQLGALRERFQDRPESAGFSVSFGCTWVERRETLDAAMMRADEDMYRHKIARLPAPQGPAGAAPESCAVLSGPVKAGRGGPIARRSVR
ncbi:GGDEF domain-containing protein [Deinococcus irradiatisoli]|nr:GGDEF domain-containing protein [Deinococcus irradiatisoli]